MFKFAHMVIVKQGGMPGAERLRDSGALQSLLKQQQVLQDWCLMCQPKYIPCLLQASGKKYAAICASPAVVFQPQGLLDGKHATCHPAFVEQLIDPRHAEDICFSMYAQIISSQPCRAAGSGGRNADNLKGSWKYF